MFLKVKPDLIFETSMPKYLQIPNFSQISEGARELIQAFEIWAYASAKIQVMVSYLCNSSDVTNFCYHCIEYIKFDTCAKFHDHWSNNEKAIMGAPPLVMDDLKKPMLFWVKKTRCVFLRFTQGKTYHKHSLFL